MLEKLARLIDGVVGLVAGTLAAVLLLYSGYVLYDNFNTNRNAFSSWDLLQYKPVGDLSRDAGYQELLSINPDVVGWLTLYDTDIDYPILQGADNMEYVNKDVYGNFSLSGAIYLAAECAPDFSDEYSLIYGHHMDNGAMFGGIDEFAAPDYFSGHRFGLIQTLEGNFDLRAFACVRTDAYEALIYNTREYRREDLEAYIRDHAVAYDQAGAAADGALVALSTCADMDTNGRLVLFCRATPHTAPVIASDEAREEAIRRRAVGHGSRGDCWALLNLACALLTAYTLLPLGSLYTKFRQIGYSRRLAKRLDAVRDGTRQDRVIRDLRHYVRVMIVGLMLEIGVAGAAGYLFYITEDFRRNMVILDRWTPCMIGLFALALLVDFICFRYRGSRPKEDSVTDEQSENDANA